MRNSENTRKAFLEFIKAGLWEKEVQLSSYGHIDYSEVMRLAEEQSMLGFVAAGLEHVEDKQITKESLLQFVGQAMQLERRNLLMNKYLSSLITLLNENGITSVLVKGQGVARCYERPLWRACGDIDLYLDKQNFIRAKDVLFPLAQKVEPQNDVTEHVNLVMRTDGWVVEIHANQHTDLSFRIDRVLDEIHQKIFVEGEVRTWDNNGTLVLLPSPENDVLIVFTHFIKHFFKGGLGLRQICDWCRLIWKYREALNTSILEQRLRQMGLFNEWKAFASMAVDWLGMPKDSMPFYSSDEKWSKKGGYIIDFILVSGNFGHNRDTSYYQHKWRIMRKTGSFMRKVSDIFRHAYVFPDSIGFIPCIMYNGVKAAIRGE